MTLPCREDNRRPQFVHEINNNKTMFSI
jgi:hypothetical protein